MLRRLSSVDEPANRLYSILILYNFRGTGEDMTKLKKLYVKIALLVFLVSAYLLSMWMNVCSLNGGSFWPLLSAFIGSLGGILFINCLIHLWKIKPAPLAPALLLLAVVVLFAVGFSIVYCFGALTMHSPAY